MRLVLDTNILLSALMSSAAPPAMLYSNWRRGDFVLTSCEFQLEELRDVSRREHIRPRIQPTEVGRMINAIRALALMVAKLPFVDASPDPYDNFMLSLALSGKADLLVTGDKRDLLALKRYGGASIVSPREAVARLQAGQA
jgi:uncharacterized protein